MPTYLFRCAEHGEFDVTRPMAEASAPATCPTCQAEAKRIFVVPPDVWHCDGSHRGDYGKGNHTGSKVDQLNREWSKYYGEAPPPPAKDVPKNSGEKF